MLETLGQESRALGVARLYVGWVDLFVIDQVDAALEPAIEALGFETVVTDTIMVDDAVRAALAGRFWRPLPLSPPGGDRIGAWI